ncbi:MAG: Hpt domain-containing protein [Acetobacteraceae bacterium]|jgi:hypothetical protein|nr:Hpt domain-containing protein [Acetobacteraceae bacterium]
MPASLPGLEHLATDGPLLDDAMIAELTDDLGAEQFGRLVRIYGDDLETRLAQLREAAAGADIASARRILHAMAGSSASIGAVALAALCRGAMHADALSPPMVEEVEAGALAVLSAFGRRGHRGGGAIG